jgi:hypothetical protein
MVSAEIMITVCAMVAACAVVRDSDCGQQHSTSGQPLAVLFCTSEVVCASVLFCDSVVVLGVIIRSQ